MSAPTLKDWTETLATCLDEASFDADGDKILGTNDPELLTLLSDALVGIAQGMPDGGLSVVEGLCAYTDFADQVKATFED